MEFKAATVTDAILFSECDIDSLLQNQAELAETRVQLIPANTLLSAGEADLIRAVVEEFELKVPTLKDEEIYIEDSGDTEVDLSADSMTRFMYGDPSGPIYVAGNKTVIAVPFEGDDSLFRVRPQTYTMNPPRAQVVGNELLLRFIRTDQNAEALKQEYLDTVNSIKQHLEWLSPSASQFNAQLESIVSVQVQARKRKLLADAGMIAAIGLPLKRRDGTPAADSVQVTRRRPQIQLLTKGEAFKPEPALPVEDYDEILRIIQNTVHVMEFSPHAFRNMREEDLRSHFVVQLNGAFEGQASGETFNFQGKTDILIRVEGKNIFIAECKFWKGEKAYLGTLDQLLSSLRWRDAKIAVLIFNYKANFQAVLGKIRQATPQHPLFKRAEDTPGAETLFRYVFGQPTDESGEASVTVLAFDIPGYEASRLSDARSSLRIST